jgi:hypothetical protein
MPEPAPQVPGVEVHTPPIPNAPKPAFNAALIQELRSILQNVRDVAISLKALQGAVASDLAQRRDVANREYGYIQKNVTEIDSQLIEADRMARDDPAFDVRDQVTLIADTWRRAQGSWPSIKELTVAEPTAAVARGLTEATTYVDEVRFLTARLTVPSQVLQYLLELNPGNSTSIRDIIVEEVPDTAMQDRIIRYLKTAHISLPGYVDADAGTIERYGNGRSSLLRLAALASGIVIIGCIVLPLFWAKLPLPFVATQAQVDAFAQILLGVWTGAAGHFVVDVVKTRSGKRPEELSSGQDFMNFLSRKEVAIYVSFLALVLVALGTTAIGPTLGFGGAFFVGYSADSMLDIVLKRFDKTLSAETAKVTAVLEG